MNSQDMFGDFLAEAHKTLITEPMRALRKTAEQHFQELDVQVGDRVRLREGILANPAYPNGARKAKVDGASLEGKVIGVKVRDGKSQLRIEGFAHTGFTTTSRGPGMGEKVLSGGQHVWFPVENYTVEVLKKAYRWTTDDQAIFAMADLSHKSLWERYSEEQRENFRRQYAGRLAKVKVALGLDQ